MIRSLWGLICEIAVGRSLIFSGWLAERDAHEMAIPFFLVSLCLDVGTQERRERCDVISLLLRQAQRVSGPLFFRSWILIYQYKCGIRIGAPNSLYTVYIQYLVDDLDRISPTNEKWENRPCPLIVVDVGRSTSNAPDVFYFSSYYKYLLMMMMIYNCTDDHWA